MPSGLISLPDYVYPASASTTAGSSGSLTIRSAGDASYTVWLAPSGTTQFAAGASMTKAAGDATSIAVPASAGTYKLFVLDAQGSKLGESAAQLRLK
jgi:hypothetical protein